jgi:hypothetical protein
MIRKMRSQIGIYLFLALSLVLFCLSMPTLVQAASTIVLDGQFNDWVGQACITDPPNDASNQGTDILKFCFASNPNVSTAYFMVERMPTSGTVTFWLYVDTNNNGAYQDSVDRAIYINYRPLGNPAHVDVLLYNGSGQYLRTIANNMDWGESWKDGGAQAEWGVSFADLGIATGQPIRFYLQSILGNASSDEVVEVQWSPANALGFTILAGILLSGSFWLSRQRMKVVK